MPTNKKVKQEYMITHKIGNHTKMGYYNSKTKSIQYYDKVYPTLFDFVYSHYMKYPNQIKTSIDIVEECKIISFF